MNFWMSPEFVASNMVWVIAALLTAVALIAITSRPVAQRALARAANHAEIADRVERCMTPRPALVPSVPLSILPDPRPAIVTHNAFLAAEARRSAKKRLTTVA